MLGGGGSRLSINGLLFVCICSSYLASAEIEATFGIAVRNC